MLGRACSLISLSEPRPRPHFLGVGFDFLEFSYLFYPQSVIWEPVFGKLGVLACRWPVDCDE